MVQGWRRDDPRVAVDARAEIAICVDGSVFGGRVEAEYGYRVDLHPNHLDRDTIGHDDTWPKGWRWVFLPPIAREAS
jgi:hypothetical protein